MSHFMRCGWPSRPCASVPICFLLMLNIASGAKAIRRKASRLPPARSQRLRVSARSCARCNSVSPARWPTSSCRCRPGEPGRRARRIGAREGPGSSPGRAHKAEGRRTESGRTAARRRPRPGCTDRRPAWPGEGLPRRIRARRGRRADQRPGSCRELSRLRPVGKAEVGEIDTSRLIEEDVGRLDVAVENPLAVGVIHGLGEVGDDLRGTAEVDRSGIPRGAARPGCGPRSAP